MNESITAFVAGLDVALLATVRAEPRELALIRKGVVKTGAGTYGQWFSTYHDIHHDLRWFVERVFPTLLSASGRADFDITDLRSLSASLIGRRMDFVSWLGLESFPQYVNEFLGLLPTMETADDFHRCVRALDLYSNQLFAWSTHYYPWGAGGLFPVRSEADLRSDLALLESEE